MWRSQGVHGTLEVKGWASSAECEAGDMNAWWRCRAVGLRVRAAPPAPAPAEDGRRGAKAKARAVVGAAASCCHGGRGGRGAAAETAVLVVSEALVRYAGSRL